MVNVLTRNANLSVTSADTFRNSKMLSAKFWKTSTLMLLQLPFSLFTTSKTKANKSEMRFHVSLKTINMNSTASTYSLSRSNCLIYPILATRPHPIILSDFKISAQLTISWLQKLLLL